MALCFTASSMRAAAWVIGWSGPNTRRQRFRVSSPRARAGSALPSWTRTLIRAAVPIRLIRMKDGKRLGVTAKSFDTASTPTTPYSLSLSDLVPPGQPSRLVTYELAEDERQVIRHDAILEDQVIHKPAAVSDGDSPTSDDFNELARVWKNAFKGRDLERE